jgi:uncharacterized HAD superfamily protein
MSRLKRIAVDLDGVVVNTYGIAFCQMMQRRFGVRLTPAKLSTYYFTKLYGITSEQLTRVFAARNFYEHLPAKSHAVRALKRIYAGGFEEHIITVRPNNDHVRSDTLRWLARHRVPFDSINIVSNHLTHEAGADAKADLARRLDLGYAVEDNPANARAYAAVCETVFLVNTPYTVGESMPSNVVRVGDLRDVARILLNLPRAVRI